MRGARAAIRVLSLAVAAALTSCATGATGATGGAREAAVALRDMRDGIPSSATTYAGSQRVLVHSSDGTLYVAYVKSVEGQNQLYVAKSTDGGASFTDFPQISAGATRSSGPHLVATPEGGLRVFWTMAASGETAEEEHVETPTGIVGVGEIEVSAELLSQAAATFQKPEEEEDEEEQERQIFTAVFDGARWSPQRQLTSGAYNGFPSAAYDSRGVLHLVWYGFDGVFYQVVYSRLEGGSWSRPELVSLGYPDSLSPSIGVDSRDNLHVAWFKHEPVTRSYQVVYRGYDSAAGRWREQIQLSRGLHTAMNASVAVGADDAVYVAYDGDTEEGGKSEVYVRVLRGREWTEQLLVGEQGRDSGMPSVAVDDAGGVSIFYHSDMDGQIHLTTSRDWSTAIALTREGRNRSPSSSARWGGVDFVWTRVGVDPENPLGANRVSYGVVPASH